MRPHSAFFLPPEIAPTADLAARSKAEHAFEAVRAHRFPQLPSRRRCHFACLSLEAADRWRTIGAREGRQLFRVEPAVTATLVAADVRFFDYAVRVFDGRWLAEHSAHAYCQPTPELEALVVAGFYWRGDRVDAHSRIEVLVEGAWTLTQGPLTPSVVEGS